MTLSFLFFICFFSAGAGAGGAGGAGGGAGPGAGPGPAPFVLRISCGARIDVLTPPTNTLWYKDFAYTGGIPANGTQPSFITPRLTSLRYFPLSEGPENCYNINRVPQGHYTIRIFFGLLAEPSFDNEPLFDISVEGTLIYSLPSGWSNHDDEQAFVEALIFLQDGTASLCFHSTGHGTHVVQIAATAPPLSSAWSVPEASSKSVSPLIQRKLIPAGAAYLEHVRRAVKNLSFEEHDAHLAEEEARQAALSGGTGVEDDLGVGDEEEDPALLSLDPKEWKKQDHYAVLGLSHLRYLATDAQIKIAHRKKVLKHHPDKKSGSTGDSNDDAFFKCIQKAMEVLTNSEKRRQFDSVDPEFESTLDEVPTPSTFKNVQNDTNAYNKKFFKEFGAVFEREARFSKKQPAPLLGQYEDSKEKVEGFYDFWYNFDSWRSFEYLDKEVNEGSDSRDDKRYTEKKNKSERARRKKEDIARVRGIVDAALQLDPRIKRIKQEEKDAREAKKKARSGTATPSAPSKADQEAAKKKAEEEAKKKDEEDKAAKEEAKKAKAAAANARKKARRQERAVDGDGDAT